MRKTDTHPAPGKRRTRAVRHRREASQPRMHQITFCIRCREAIPAQALACFRCGAKQPAAAGAPLQVFFCRKCGRDYPARAMACHHCGHINPRHPYLRGHIAS